MRVNLITFILVIGCICYSNQLEAQIFQQVKGTVIDQVVKTPVAGAVVHINGTDFSTITDKTGSFRFNNIPIGNYQLSVSHIAYNEAVIEDIVVNSGKETILTINLETKVRVEKEVEVKATTKRNRPINDMSIVSARAFTVEETQKYAAAVNDPLRMVTAFPGVIAANDGNNDIIIRGNAPTGLLWRMEGIDIPNPNHYSNAGSTGGGISILSAQLLSNSDFLTSAFAAEYGNALSGVFDLRLRKGNNEKNEYSLQAGLLGLNAAAEGPFKKGYKGSFLANYRYSTLAMLSKIGIKLSSGETNFQDFSFNIHLPTRKAGEFGIFGFGGHSTEKEKVELDPSRWTTPSDRYGNNYLSNVGMSGLSHSFLLSPRVNWRNIVAISYNKIAETSTYVKDDLSQVATDENKFVTQKITYSSTMNIKWDARNHLRLGWIANRINLDYHQIVEDNSTTPPGFRETFNVTNHSFSGQGFLQWQFRPSNKLNFNIGAHYLHFFYNQTKSLEPRASLRWDLNGKHQLAFGYGLHSQLQNLGVYFSQVKDANGGVTYPNKDLDFTKAHHFVLSHQYNPSRNLRLKTEAYYQKLYNVPISSSINSTFSMLNVEYGFVTEPLINKGTGLNYGLEFSIDKSLSNNYYLLLSQSLYQSKYKALDNIERNTRFNGNFLTTFSGGKEFVRKNGKQTFGASAKIIYAGGMRVTPIDLDKSIALDRTVYKENEAFSKQNPNYFRTDTRLYFKWNRVKRTNTLSLDIQNVTNRENLYYQQYSRHSKRITNVYQNGIIPVINYKVEF